VLFASHDGAVVAAAHAGWRGMCAGVLEGAVAAMQVAPRHIVAWLGPAIGKEHFEVGEEVRAAFLAHDKRAADAFVGNARGRWQCDLLLLARQRLATIGLGGVSAANLCTYAATERCFSYRRDGRTGRMAALIWRTETGP
jgi:polyphenol oxidase